MYFLHQGLDYLAVEHDLGNGEYEVDVYFVGTMTGHVSPEVQRYAEDLYHREVKNEKRK